MKKKNNYFVFDHLLVFEFKLLQIKWYTYQNYYYSRQSK